MSDNTTNKLDALSLEIEDIKSSLQILDAKLNQIIAKLDEFTIVSDTSEDDEYNTEWSPYSDNDDNYDDEEYYDDDNEL